MAFPYTFVCLLPIARHKLHVEQCLIEQQWSPTTRRFCFKKKGFGTDANYGMATSIQNQNQFKNDFEHLDVVFESVPKS